MPPSYRFHGTEIILPYRPKHIVEFAAVWAFAGLMRCLPYRAALSVGWCVAWIAHRLVRYRVDMARARIRSVLGPDLSTNEVQRIAWLSWRNIVFTAIEMLRVSRITRTWLDRHSDAEEAVEIFSRHTATGKGAVIACPHMGNWELAAVNSHFHNIPVFSIAAAQKNPLVDRYWNDLRRAPGIETFARGSGLMKQVIRNLRAGRLLAILPDVRVRTEGLPIPFLGGTANLGAGMALFARQCEVPIFPVIVTRIGWARHRVTVHPLIYPDLALTKEQDFTRMTTAVMTIIEAAIRRQPEQWFWFNKRWVLDPL
jgi:Kdo2-lipid IVA lauroyltransferase/acyltransferase